ncbi:MAG: efflux RND transporter periplasmic adaptor subunit, partial [Gammaproteobacteria bacterium]|nr:efflux RND transporter periplasmic adaptor subunit [Gammaproteobacteria bacterium]
AGQNVNVQIIKASTQPTFVIPNAAIAQSEGQAYLFIRNDQGFKVSPINVVGKQKHHSILTGTDALKENIEVAIRGTVALKASWLDLGGDE